MVSINEEGGGDQDGGLGVAPGVCPCFPECALILKPQGGEGGLEDGEVCTFSTGEELPGTLVCFSSLRSNGCKLDEIYFFFCPSVFLYCFLSSKVVVYQINPSSSTL